MSVASCLPLPENGFDPGDPVVPSPIVVLPSPWLGVDVGSPGVMGNASFVGGSFRVFGHTANFHFEGFHRWADEENMRRFARAVTEFVIDNDDPLRNGFAPDNGGGIERAGLPPSPDAVRRTAGAYVEYRLVLLSAFDDTGKIARVSSQIQDRYPNRDTTRLAAGLFVDDYLNGR